MQHTT